MNKNNLIKYQIWNASEDVYVQYFIKMPNEILADDRVDFCAMILYSFILSLQDGYMQRDNCILLNNDFIVDNIPMFELENKSNTCNKIKKALDNLVENCYITYDMVGYDRYVTVETYPKEDAFISIYKFLFDDKNLDFKHIIILSYIMSVEEICYRQNKEYFLCSSNFLMNKIPKLSKATIKAYLNAVMELGYIDIALLDNNKLSSFKKQRLIHINNGFILNRYSEWLQKIEADTEFTITKVLRQNKIAKKEFTEPIVEKATKTTDKYVKYKSRIKRKNLSIEQTRAYYSWIEASVDRSFLTIPLVDKAVDLVNKYSNGNEDKAIELINYAAESGLRDMQWAINNLTKSVYNNYESEQSKVTRTVETRDRVSNEAF